MFYREDNGMAYTHQRVSGQIFGARVKIMKYEYSIYRVLSPNVAGCPLWLISNRNLIPEDWVLVMKTVIALEMTRLVLSRLDFQ